LVPAKFVPVAPDGAARAPVFLTVTRGGAIQPITALEVALAELLAWADVATTHEIERVRAARSGERVILMGEKLPALPGARRFWGVNLLVPAGFRPSPDLPEGALREVIGADAGELALLTESGAEIVPRAAFEPLTRAGVRLGASA
ncbi:MAG: hypothetical protein K2X91_07390, partial [Thermoleophilia bacterium]|nr:hypothetical protein [Thermoleophilia bacterium]